MPGPSGIPDRDSQERPPTGQALLGGGARSRTARPIPVQAAGIYEAPYDWEERRQVMAIAGVKRLNLFVPEAHDLALMKVSRGLTHDASSRWSTGCSGRRRRRMSTEA